MRRRPGREGCGTRWCAQKKRQTGGGSLGCGWDRATRGACTTPSRASAPTGITGERLARSKLLRGSYSRESDKERVCYTQVSSKGALLLLNPVKVRCRREEAVALPTASGGTSPAYWRSSSGHGPVGGCRPRCRLREVGAGPSVPADGRRLRPAQGLPVDRAAPVSPKDCLSASSGMRVQCAQFTSPHGPSENCDPGVLRSPRGRESAASPISGSRTRTSGVPPSSQCQSTGSGSSMAGLEPPDEGGGDRSASCVRGAPDCLSRDDSCPAPPTRW